MKRIFLGLIATGVIAGVGCGGEGTSGTSTTGSGGGATATGTGGNTTATATGTGGEATATKNSDGRKKKRRFTSGRILFNVDEKGVWAAPDGTKVAWFRDPDGNLLSVSQHAK